CLHTVMCAEMTKNSHLPNKITDPSIVAIWNELKMLRDTMQSLNDLVIEQRVELRNLRSRQDDTERMVEEERNNVLLVELVMSREKMSELEKENAVLSAELSAVGLRVTANEKDLDLQTGLIGTIETEVQLQQIKIAFTVGLTESVGPFNTEKPLKYNSILTNIGNGYNSILGNFIAPVKRVYYFRFTAFHLEKGHTLVMHNAEPVNTGGHSYLSNAVTLQLNVGDLVYMHLPPSYSLWDNGSSDRNTFSGFLLFST
uniref:C1q domain-containing protein n=1 Tax=Sphaeramia orbicularis TaxID=375764 RepID=A0A673AUQ9_9TELE